MAKTRKKKLWKLLPLVRAISVLSAVGIITTTMVTFAAIHSNGSALAGNTIQTATASLQISKDAVNWGDSVPGYTFSGLVPGGTPQPTANGGYLVYLRNTGTAPLRLLLNVPTTPNVTGTVDLSKVSVLLTPPTVLGFPAPPTQSIPLSSLIAGTVLVDDSTVSIAGMVSFHIQVSMAADAVSGSSATISALDLSFSGTPQ